MSKKFLIDICTFLYGLRAGFWVLFWFWVLIIGFDMSQSGIKKDCDSKGMFKAGSNFYTCKELK